MLAKKLKSDLLKAIGGLDGTSVSFSQCYLGLLKGAPEDESTSTYPSYSDKEISKEGTGYKRCCLGYYRTGSSAHQETITKVAVQVIDGNPVLTNTDIIYLGEALNSWGTASHFGLFSAGSNGNLYAWGEIKNLQGAVTPITPAIGDVPLVRVGEMKITIE